VTILLDDHLLRDWLAGPDRELRTAVRRHSLATTNLWYARLCKSAASIPGGGPLLRHWDLDERAALVSALVAVPEKFEILPMRHLAWRMGVLISEHSGLSTLGSEAVAAAEALAARVLVSSRDDSPGIRASCRAVGLHYETLARR
jgi:hypothetical protein